MTVITFQRQYNQVEKVLDQLPANDSKSRVALKIDEVLKVVDEYKDLILKSEGIPLNNG